MLGPVVAPLLLLLMSEPVHKDAKPASWVPVPAAALFRPSSTFMYWERSTAAFPLRGFAFLKGASVARNTSGLVVASAGVAGGVKLVGELPWAPHRYRTTPHALNRSTRKTGSLPVIPA